MTVSHFLTNQKMPLQKYCNPLTALLAGNTSHHKLHIGSTFMERANFVTQKSSVDSVLLDVPLNWVHYFLQCWLGCSMAQKTTRIVCQLSQNNRNLEGLPNLDDDARACVVLIFRTLEYLHAVPEVYTSCWQFFLLRSDSFNLHFSSLHHLLMEITAIN